MRIIYGLIRDILFNFYGYPRVRNILETDTFFLKTSLTSYDSIGGKINVGGRYFFLSLSTTKYSNYIRNRLGCNMVLDANRIRHNYSLVPVNFGYEDGFNSSFDETEVRVLSKNPIIPKASSIILEVHGLLPSRDYGFYSEDLDKIQEICKLKNILCYWYKNGVNEDAYKIQDTRRAKIDWNEYYSNSTYPPGDAAPKEIDFKSKALVDRARIRIKHVLKYLREGYSPEIVSTLKLYAPHYAAPLLLTDDVEALEYGDRANSVDLLGELARWLIKLRYNNFGKLFGYIQKKIQADFDSRGIAY